MLGKCFYLVILLGLIKSLSGIKNITKCGSNKQIIPRKIEEIKIKEDSGEKRKLDNDYHDLNIVLEYKNIEKEIELNNLTSYKDLILNSMNKAAETLNSLLKAVQKRQCFLFYDDFVEEYGFYYWDKARFGINSTKKYFYTCDYGIDLLIFLRFINSEEKNDDSLVNSQIYWVKKADECPIIGGIILNKEIFNSTIKVTSDYLNYIFLHAFTHVLGFDNYHLRNTFYNSIIEKKDKNGITRRYVKFDKVVQVAKRYFNCNDIEGVELEESETTISHWESRILLGEYMNTYIYEPEQVISEFTLSFLEGTGYYTANYYTGGMMQYGRNKGCSFLMEKCVNNYEINPKFENKFFDTINSGQGIDPSCSSGRQSRAYFVWWVHNNIPEYYQYHKNSSIGGFNNADYCPVAQYYYKEKRKNFYVGRCNNIGSGDYGSQIFYSDIALYTNEDLEDITGETYSNTSFCYLSSLTREIEQNNEIYSKVVRALCYETFCSYKSLTVKIHDNYIVCPRRGGKINAIGFLGYFMCPDYYLICSGTVLCNDMFDCVEKKSEIKNESYFYDYDSKTSQNIENAEIEDPDDEYNYELSHNGKCPIYCKQCLEDQKCLKCKEDYELVGNKDNESVICLSVEDIYIGYYKNETNSIYYKCSENCEKCSNDKICNMCNENYALIGNKENDEIKCAPLDTVEIGYYKDNNSVYYKCKENCIQCSDSNICDRCNDSYGLIEDKESKELICISEDELISGYYKDNNSIFRECSTNCEKCLDGSNCIKCKEDYAKINNINTTCYLIEEILPYYYQDPLDNSNYIKCSNTFDNCLICNSAKCLECRDKYNFINNNYNKCFLTEANLYVLQTQIIRNELHLFMISDSLEQENVTLTLKIDIYNNNGLYYIPRVVHDEIVVELKNNSVNEIMDFSASILRFILLRVDYIVIRDIIINENYTNKIININYPNNKDKLNTRKVDELIDNGEVDFYGKYNDENYIINQYNIENIYGECDLNNNFINEDDINITLNFQDINNSSNILNINCFIDKNNYENIKCPLYSEMNNTYSLQNNIYYNENELYIINVKNKNSTFEFLCFIEPDITNIPQKSDYYEEASDSEIIEDSFESEHQSSEYNIINENFEENEINEKEINTKESIEFYTELEEENERENEIRENGENGENGQYEEVYLEEEDLYKEENLEDEI